VYLSGLTCTDENVVNKAGFQEHAEKHGIAIICPDTSPRGVNLPGEEDSYDFGTGAGFYLDATEAPWSKHYRMGSYVTGELLELCRAHLPVDGRFGVTGHSMGGHGALTGFLRNPGLFVSVSALAPICRPTECPWGEKAFKGYLGSLEAGKAYDACELVKAYDGPVAEILLDQGLEDEFYPEQLRTEDFVAACGEAGYPVRVRFREGMDHLYPGFVSQVIADHIEFHAEQLKKADGGAEDK